MDFRSSNNIQIKGIREGVLVILNSDNWAAARADIIEQLGVPGSFFSGAHIALNVGNLTIRAAELGSLRDALSERGITLWAVISCSSITEQNAQILGLVTHLSSPHIERPYQLTGPIEESQDAQLFSGPIRPGVRIVTDRHVIIKGDVYAGAEISTDGSILVWGRIRGAVLAGQDGDETASICALELNPTSLWIHNHPAKLIHHRGRPQPQIALFTNGEVIIRNWKPKNI